MPDIYIVAFDGSDASHRAVDFAVGRAQLAQAHLHIVHVLEWSPYSFLTQDELAERHKRRTEEIERAQNHLLNPIAQTLTQAGQTVTTEVRYGNVAKVLHEIALEKSAKIIYLAKSNDSKLASVFLGSVTSALVQITTIPVAIVP